MFCAGVPWSARAVSWRFCTELEAGRKALRINWPTCCADMHRLRAMSRLPRLKMLYGNDCPLSHVSSFAHWSAALKVHHRVTDMAPVAACTALRCLDVNGCSSLTDVSAMQACSGLTALDMNWCTSLVDITPLAS